MITLNHYRLRRKKKKPDARIFKGDQTNARYYIPGIGSYDLSSKTWEHYPAGIAQIRDNVLNYTIKDHLTNIRAIVGTTATCTTPGTITAYDYYPYGKILRKYESVESRYKSTNHEKDEETGYDDRGARWWDDERLTPIQPDPHAYKYPSLSSYSSMGCNPISIIDKDGKDIIFVIRKGDNTSQYRYNSGNFYNIETGARYNPSKESISKTMYQVLETYRKIENSGDKVLINKLHSLEESKLTHYIQESAREDNLVSRYGIPLSLDKKMRIGTSTEFDFNQKTLKEYQKKEGVPFTPSIIVTHEMGHQYDHDQGNSEDNESENSARDPFEIRAVKNENRMRRLEKLPKRTSYGGEKIDSKLLNDIE